MIYKNLWGFYHDFQMRSSEKICRHWNHWIIDILIAPDNIRKKLKSENDIYKFEYCSLDEKTYKIAYIPLEWRMEAEKGIAGIHGCDTGEESRD